jgi:hypothetical protein
VFPWPWKESERRIPYFLSHKQTDPATATIACALKGCKHSPSFDISVAKTTDRKGTTEMKHSLSMFAAALALALTATAQSQANPFSYTYNWSASPIAIAAGTGGVTLTDENPVTTTVQTDTAATNITVFSAAPTSSPDVIPTPAGGSNYTLAVTLTDSLGTGTGTITFTGLLLGKLTHDSSNLTNTITGVTDGIGTHPGQTFGSVVVDGFVYTVSYNGFAAPGPEAQHNQGAISFHIAYAVEVSGGPTAPEPSSMVLGCLGLMFFGGIGYRARRRKADLLNAAV